MMVRCNFSTAVSKSVSPVGDFVPTAFTIEKLCVNCRAVALGSEADGRPGGAVKSRPPKSADQNGRESRTQKAFHERKTRTLQNQELAVKKKNEMIKQNKKIN